MNDFPGTTTEIRTAHRFDEGALADYLQNHTDRFSGGLEIRQFEGGQSNPTFLVRTGDRFYVLRKKPPGKLLPSAHQVDREYRVMKALAGSGVPVPEMICLCTDPSVIGTDFYVMSFIDGRIFRDPQLPEIAAGDRSAIYESMISVMATLHNVDYKAVGLDDFGRPGNYFERQIGRWSKQYHAAQTEEVESMEHLIRWMPEHIPGDQSVTIAHGDFRLENSVYDPSEPRMTAILDWELSTIGHPLADLGYNCMLYHIMSPQIGGLVGVDYAATGIPDERSYVRRYCELTGRDSIEDWDFYVAFSIFRLASIAQGVYKRGLDGNASSERAMMFKDACRMLTDTAWNLLTDAGMA